MVSDAVPVTGRSGKARASVGFQSKARAGTLKASGAFKGQSRWAGIGRRSTFIRPSPRPAAMSKAHCHLAFFTGVLGSTSGIGSANSNGPQSTLA